MLRTIMTNTIATIALAGGANAATITVSATFDPATLAPGTLNDVPIDPVTIGAGDTLDITIDFLGGAVTIGAGSPIWFGLLTGVGDTLDTVSTISFTGGSANLVSSFGPLPQTNSAVHVGSFFANPLITTGAGDFSFVTANQLLDVISAPAGPRVYDSAFFFYATTITGGGVIPEPATWGLMIAGFGLVGAAIRRRTAAIA